MALTSIKTGTDDQSPISTTLSTPRVECASGSKCTFDLKTDLTKSPHYHESDVYKRCQGPISNIYDTILDHVGMTPIVRINNISKAAGIECELLAKCEFFNAGGSVKDRIGKRMIMDAERSGRIKKGDTLIEPTSGNTGIGLALTAAILGYKMIVTMPEKMSNEKVFILRALGAQIIRTPTEASFDSPESHIGVANRLNEEIEDSHILDQYSNPSNPLAHFDGTAEEILKQCNNKVDMVVIGAGTGGTITGIAAKLKMKLPNVIVVGVDPKGSILAEPKELNKEGIHSYQVEGIGYDFIPKVLHRKYVDYWIKTDDKEALLMARRLIREEGLLCGGSSGTAMVAAIRACKNLKKGERCVVILPDSIRNYMTKHLSDDWMIDKGFLEEKEVEEKAPGIDTWWSDSTVKDLDFSAPVTVSETVNVESAIQIMKNTGYDQLPVLKDEQILGVVTLGDLTSKILSNRVNGKDSVTKCMFGRFKFVTLSTKLGKLSKIFNSHHFCLVVTEQQQYMDSSNTSKKQMIVGILTRIDLLNHIVKKKKDEYVEIE